MKKIFFVLWIHLYASMVVFGNNCEASWDNVSLEPCGLESTGLNKEELTEQFRGILKNWYSESTLMELENNYEDLNIYFYQMAPEQIYFVIFDQNINVWAIVSKQNYFFNKQPIEGQVCLEDGIFLWNRRNTEQYRVFMKYHYGVRSGSGSGSYSAWEVDLTSKKFTPLFSVSWPESVRREWPGDPVYMDNVFYLKVKMPTDWFLRDIDGIQWVTLDQIGLGVEFTRKSAIFVEVTLPPVPLIPKK